MVKIAVLIASYNGSRYLEEQIRSIREQSGVEVDIFLQDDCSKDDTVAISRKLLPPDRINVNSSPTGSAANNFFQMVRDFRFPDNYDYFAFADQDDIWLPQKLEKAVSQLKMENAALYFSNLQNWDTRTDVKTILKKDYPQKKFDYLFEGGSAGCTYVFTRDFFKLLKEALSNTDYLHWKDFSHDWFTYFVARNAGLKVVSSSDAEILYRIHDSNVHGQLNTLSFNTISRRLKMVTSGWYIHNSEGFAKCISKDSEAFEIYRKYCKNFFTRLEVLYQYRFELLRRGSKFLQFVVLSLFFTGYSKKENFNQIFNR